MSKGRLSIFFKFAFCTCTLYLVHCTWDRVLDTLWLGLCALWGIILGVHHVTPPGNIPRWRSLLYIVVSIRGYDLLPWAVTPLTVVVLSSTQTLPISSIGGKAKRTRVLYCTTFLFRVNRVSFTPSCHQPPLPTCLRLSLLQIGMPWLAHGCRKQSQPQSLIL